MSHFTTLIIIPKKWLDKSHIETIVNKQLAPFDENMELEPFEEKCHCVGRVARTECENKAIKKFGETDVLREKFKKEQKKLLDKLKTLNQGSAQHNDLNSKINIIWEEEYIAPLNNYVEKLFQKHPDKDKADPNCGFYTQSFIDSNYTGQNELLGKRFKDKSGCGATGKTISTYNPNSKWDWYVIGGRWNNSLPNKRNIIPMEKLGNYEAFSYLTPDGKWIEQGQIGMFATTLNKENNKDWNRRFEALRTKYKKGYMGILVDCHI